MVDPNQGRPRIRHRFDWARPANNGAFCSICGLKALLISGVGRRYQLMDGRVVDEPPPCLPRPALKITRRYRTRKRKRQKRRV